MLRMMLLAAALLLTGAEARAADPLDELFIRYEVQGSAYELALARLGQVRATRPDIRAFADMLVNDHETYGTALRDLARSKDIAAPPGLTATGQHRLDRLADKHGAAFDAAFLRETQRINDDQIRSFRKEASSTTDPEINAFIKRFLAIDEKHNARARALSSRNVASRTTVIPPPTVGDSTAVITPPNTGR
jgi:putative membrane protein